MPYPRDLHPFPTRRSSDLDVSTLGLMVAVIKHLGLKPLSAGNGREALVIIAAEDPAAVILDLLMPELDGFEVLRQLSTRSPYIDRKSTRLNSSHSQISYAVPPRSTPFPYPTLFRSRRLHVGTDGRRHQASRSQASLCR